MNDFNKRHDNRGNNSDGYTRSEFGKTAEKISKKGGAFGAICLAIWAIWKGCCDLKK
jgi:hypothetical protein